jgi:hypothetical protein
MHYVYRAARRSAGDVSGVRGEGETMTLAEQDERAWLARLGRTPEQQRRALVELLRYSAQDEMSAADRAICRTALDRLDREAAHV